MQEVHSQSQAIALQYACQCAQNPQFLVTIRLESNQVRSGVSAGMLDAGCRIGFNAGI